ncbi:M28 family peptidase [Reichenbachiella agarivorans]|uniref:M28 family peptidase n=1 Tax=Reichenbachiella agarivorans TaxID=2979464 RepID=A0ABY6CMX3_9BACT|nr:M28 family peptidase [Reichenbachiella agarivorans]UXP31869.1 M28 family peptidase [Reichenbachiella agarivorans]
MVKNVMVVGFWLLSSFCALSQSLDVYQRMYGIVEEVSSERIEKDIRKLVSFDTRHTLSDTVSKKTGIGAARRWIKTEFDKISVECGGCLEVMYVADTIKKDLNQRITRDVYVVSVIAIQRGTTYPDRYVMMSGDIDSRVTDVNNFKDRSPGANDNASGMAGVIEAARVLSKHQYPGTIVYAGLAGEEQGLFGGQILAAKATAENWDIIGIMNNDMIGNIEGVDGVIDNRTFRIFSEPTPVTETEKERDRRRYYGGEVDGVSRQLARYIFKTTQTYMPEMNPMMVYRLDRFGRGGHHKPFNDAGFPGVRIMEAHENYNRQHQDVRIENGVKYGDVIEGVNFEYCSKITAVNAINLASLAMAPDAPKNVKIGGIVEPSTKLAWDKTKDENVIGYNIYWRLTTSPTWDMHRFVGNVTEFTLEGIVIDNYMFGVAAVSKDGVESIVTFPSEVMR